MFQKRICRSAQQLKWCCSTWIIIMQIISCLTKSWWFSSLSSLIVIDVVIATRANSTNTSRGFILISESLKKIIIRKKEIVKNKNVCEFQFIFTCLLLRKRFLDMDIFIRQRCFKIFLSFPTLLFSPPCATKTWEMQQKSFRSFETRTQVRLSPRDYASFCRMSSKYVNNN